MSEPRAPGRSRSEPPFEAPRWARSSCRSRRRSRSRGSPRARRPGALGRAALADVEPFVAEQQRCLEDLRTKPEHKDEFIVRRFEQRGESSRASRSTAPGCASPSRMPCSPSSTTYRGLATKLYYLDNWFTPPYAGADQRIASQRWHRDPEEEHVVKAFLYLSDVDEEAGPFEYVKGSPPGNRYGESSPTAGRRRTPSDDELDRRGAGRRARDDDGPGGDDDLLRHERLPPGRLRAHEAAGAGAVVVRLAGRRRGRRFEVDVDGRRSSPPEARAALA